MLLLFLYSEAFHRQAFVSVLDFCTLVTCVTPVLFLFPDRSQWRGTPFFPGWMSLEGAFVCLREGAPRGDAH